MSGRADSERDCLARLHQMQSSLAEMQPQLPEDMRALGDEARRRVDFWLQRIAAGGADLGELSDAMAGLADLMNALTNRLLLTPWQGPRAPKS